MKHIVYKNNHACGTAFQQNVQKAHPAYSMSSSMSATALQNKISGCSCGYIVIVNCRFISKVLQNTLLCNYNVAFNITNFFVKIERLQKKTPLYNTAKKNNLTAY